MTLPMLFSSETFGGLSDSWSGSLGFAKRVTKMEDPFSSLRENQAIERLKGFLDRRISHNQLLIPEERKPWQVNPKPLAWLFGA